MIQLNATVVRLERDPAVDGELTQVTYKIDEAVFPRNTFTFATSIAVPSLGQRYSIELYEVVKGKDDQQASDQHDINCECAACISVYKERTYGKGIPDNASEEDLPL